MIKSFLKFNTVASVRCEYPREKLFWYCKKLLLGSLTNLRGLRLGLAVAVTERNCLDLRRLYVSLGVMQLSLALSSLFDG